MEVQIHYELAAMTFMMAATLVFFKQRHLRVYRSSLFFCLMLMGVVTAVCDVFCGIVMYHPVPVLLGYIVQPVFLVVSMIYSVTYSLYAMELLHRLDYIGGTKRKVLWCVPFAVGVIAIAVTPFTGMLYSFDPQGIFHRGNWYYLIAFICIIYILIPLMLMQRVSFVSRRIKKWIIAIPVAMVTAKILQYTFFPDLLFAYAVNSVVIFCCYLFLQNSDYYMDEVTGFFKMHGFEETVREKMA